MNNLKHSTTRESATPLNREEFSSIAESLFRRAHAGLSDNELNALVEAKTAAHDNALNDADSAVALLKEIATELPTEQKAELDAAIENIGRMTMFNGDASMDFNHQWNIG